MKILGGLTALSALAAAASVLPCAVGAQQSGGGAPAPASSPSMASRVLLIPRGGFINYATNTAIKGAPLVGLDVRYNVSRFFSVAPSLTVSQPRTNGDYFPAALFYGDTLTQLFRVTQPLTMLDAAITGVAHAGDFGRVSPYVQGGVGVYTLYLDPEVSSGEKRISHTSYSIGGGLNFRITGRTGLVLDVRDLVFTNYDRDRMNPVRSNASAIRYLDDFPKARPQGGATSMHNVAFSLGFTFIPTGSGTTEGEDDNR
jgi:hypothetical protein